MRQFWNVIGILLVLHFAESRIIIKRQIDNTDAAIDPIQEISYDVDDRDKRGVAAATDGKYAIKNALLGFVFNPSKSISTSFVKPSSTTRRPTTTEDIVIFEKGQAASLELPSQLFGSTFTTITRVSTAISDLMINSAIRLQRALEIFRPSIRAMFGVKGFVSEVTTDKPIFSDASSTPK
ncbi:hypothetical protein PPYR_07616 [Photinus pyralis]|uniref:Uncharacterized protein n=1 Tax=Photinus pyralis TaxID=7054 RepID=A0A5N4AR12_PHOPY|nr:uncharacterized protein LOC116169292 isoform X2 [Photinus pyralis]XP_031341224.1 uncharacterized protein LOC116169300 isoform X2 [Photinus pyralis]KAB0799736.1 hypothetical protein PPYR_07616 [Photinus pyralis]